jgi:putative tryptophan/tyrosine transport system substrate-binding protein
VRKREFITLTGGAAATWPLAARAQQGERVRRVGWLAPQAVDDPQGQANVAMFQQTLRKLGWIAGRNLSISRTIAIDFNRSAAEAVSDSRPNWSW